MQSRNFMIIGALVLVLLVAGSTIFANKQSPRAITPSTTSSSNTDNNSTPLPDTSATEIQPSPTTSQQTTTTTVTLTSQNNSGEDGTATLTEKDGKVLVTLSIPNAPTTPQPAHIHVGSCPTPGSVKYPLTNVTSGQSETTLNTTIEALKKQLPLAINVHKSPAEISSYVACGDIKF